MKASYLFVIMLDFVLLGCGSDQPKETVPKAIPETQQALPPAKKYSKPQIGMTNADFTNLCGQPNKTSASESAKGKTVKYKYKYSSDRAMSGCWGTFTFVDSILDSMHKD